MTAFLFNHKMSFLLRSFCFLFLVSCFLNTFASPTQHLCHPDQRDALLEFKTEFLVYSNASCYMHTMDCFCYPKTESWVNKNDCCSWDGITCDVKSGKVIGLDLSHSCLHGQLESNSSLFRLRHLRDLNLAYNDFIASSIPAEFDNLMGLERLNLSESSLSGQIPTKLLQLTKLVSLDLSSNNFVGEIPSSIGNLSHLSHLDLSSNNFVGEIPSSIGNLSHLSYLLLSFNDFVGDIPSSIGILSHLSDLDLSSNNFDGEIPSSIGNLKQLIDFRVSGNKLSGNLPTAIRNLTQLSILSLSYNQFTVDLNVFSPLKQLQRLYLSGIPLSTANITSDFLDFPSHLEMLDLRGCNITEFPQFIRYQRHLWYLDLSNNKIKGQVPDLLWRLPELDFVFLSNNSLSGFNGSLEASPGSRISYVDLSSNAFQGPLFIPSSKSLRYFFGSKNNFTGEIPRSICRLSYLEVLDLANNNLHGSIPRCLETLMSSLSDLNLRNNSLSGSLPEIFMNATNLMSLDVSHNRMEGKLPASLTGCSALEVLNVGSNKINDLFPFQLKSLQKLQVLVLRSNKFHGTLHNADGLWFGFPQLKIIDVSRNVFLGTLPSDYFLNWTAMSSKRDNNMKAEYITNPFSLLSSMGYYTSLVLMSKGVSMEMERILTIYTAIDFSGNQLHGQIPDSIGLLKELHILNMSSNAFTGHIPSSLANLTNLESLDLSQNKISGEIPPEIGTLSSLEWINVSHNQLVGSIPQGTQFQRQQCSSYDGNPGLYGPSLKDVCGDIKAPTPPLETKEEEEEEEEESLSWIGAGLGFAPGVVFGLAMGYIVTSYKHEWFMKTFGRSKQRSTITR